MRWPSMSTAPFNWSLPLSLVALASTTPQPSLLISKAVCDGGAPGGTAPHLMCWPSTLGLDRPAADVRIFLRDDLLRRSVEGECRERETSQKALHTTRTGPLHHLRFRPLMFEPTRLRSLRELRRVSVR